MNIDRLLLSIFGLCVGSFLNVLIYRLNVPGVPKFWQGRSFCPECQHQLSLADNIPLLSFLILKGRCRYCHKNISWQYPTVEILTAIFFALSGLHPVIWLIGSAFIVIFFSDLVYGLIPDEAVAAIFLMSLMGHMSLMGFAAATAAGLASAVFFLLIFLLTKQKGLGFGDVKLAGAIGFFLGWPKTPVAFWSGFILGGFFAVILLILKKTKLSATIPLGPFLILGTIISALWSNELLSALVSLR